MSSVPATSAEAKSESAGQLRAQSAAMTLSGYVLSLILHATIIAVLFLWAFRGGGGGIGPADGEDEYHDIGVLVQKRTESQKTEPVDENDKQDSQSPTEPSKFAPNESAVPHESEVPKEPPVKMQLPTNSRPTIGPGASTPNFSPGTVLQIPTPAGVASPSALMTTRSDGTTSFFKIKDKGTRYVYVVDRSYSMGANLALQEAKRELKASLQQLKPTQKFQVIFFNDFPHPLKLRSDEKPLLHWATDINKTLARQDIDAIRPRGGTNRVKALREALSFSPEVIYFLTDDDNPLQAADLNGIKSLNSGRTRIHCIQFGKGPQIGDANFLARLSGQNGGTYVYRDVKKFLRR